MPLFCHVTTVHPRDDVRILHKQCVSLKELTVSDVTLIVGDGKGSGSFRGVEILDLGKPGFGRLGRAILGNIRVWRILRRMKPSLVHLHDPELLVAGCLLRACKQLVVFDMHENLPSQILGKNWLPRWSRRLISSFVSVAESAILPRMAVIFAESSYRVHYRSLTNSQVVLNLPKLDSFSAVERRQSHPSTIGYIGGVTVDRGAIVTLTAIRALRSAGFDVDFECVGPVETRVRESEEFRLAQQEGWARFSGRLAPTEGWSKIAACSVGLAVLAPIGNYLESYPTKMFEYMALGVPVIVSNFPFYREVVERAGCGLWVDPLDPEALRVAIRWFLEHAEEGEVMGRRGKDAVADHYSWANEAKKLVAFYERLGAIGRARGAR